MDERIRAWELASEIVSEIVEQHGLEHYRSGTVLQTNYVSTKVDQHIVHIMAVADWILKEENQ